MGALSRQQRIGLWAALAVAFALRLALVVHAEAGGHFAFGDGRFYLELGRSLAAGRGLAVSPAVFDLEPGRGAWTEALMARWRRTGLWDFIRPGYPTAFVMPLYPCFVGGVFRLFGPHLLAARVVQLLLSLAVPALTFSIGRRLFGARAGVLAAWGAALYPFFIFYAASLTNQLFSILALLAVVEGYYRFRDRRNWAAALAFGVVAGLAFLTRAELAGPALLGGLLVLGAALKAGGRGRALGRFAAFAAVAVLVALPWAARNAASLGHFSFLSTQGPRVLWEANLQPLSAEFGRGDVAAYELQYDALRARELPRLRRADLAEMPAFDAEGEFERAAILQARVAAFVRANPRAYLGLCGVRARQFLRFGSLNFGGPVYALSYGSYAVVFILGVAGLVVSFRRPAPYLYVLLAYGAAVLVFVVYGTAFRASSVDPWLIIFGGLALDRVWARLRPRGEAGAEARA